MAVGKEVGVVTLFPETILQVVEVGIPRKAIAGGQLAVSTYNPRDYTTDAHRTVDDRPFGGGPGMVMKVAPLRAALEDAKSRLPGAEVIYLSPQGKRFDQPWADALARSEHPLILLAGRYEGIDERLIARDVDDELSIGDVVLSGGEIAALTVIDAVARLLPGVLGHQDSAAQDSFAGDGLLDHPHYTRPDVLDNVAVPEVLLSGDHKKIAAWRRNQALMRTWQRRPELLQNVSLSEEDQVFLAQLRDTSLNER